MVRSEAAKYFLDRLMLLALLPDTSDVDPEGDTDSQQAEADRQMAQFVILIVWFVGSGMLYLFVFLLYRRMEYVCGAHSQAIPSHSNRSRAGDQHRSTPLLLPYPDASLRGWAIGHVHSVALRRCLRGVSHCRPLDILAASGVGQGERADQGRLTT